MQKKAYIKVDPESQIGRGTQGEELVIPDLPKYAVNDDPEFELRLNLETVEHEVEPEEESFTDADMEMLEEESVETESSDEAEDRHKEHLRRKKNDKIFNNSYNTGDGYGLEEHSYRTDIRISPSHSDSYLHDTQKYRDHLDQSITQEDIMAFVHTCPEIQEILAIDPSRKKYSKQEVNFMFGKIKGGLERGFAKSCFISVIYILDAISAITTLEYKKIFDVLDYEHKESLLMELNQKFHILEQNHKSKKLF